MAHTKVEPKELEKDFYKELHTELLFINLGPSHPASHGTLRTFCALDGETIKAAVTEIGYLHRGFEKTVEHKTYNQAIPYTDRLNYVSSIMNNVGFAKAVEKMLGIQITDRCIFIRVILSELMRIIDHLVCIAANLVDIGALTNFWYLYNQRELVYTILEKLTGARLTNSFTRIGGLYRDLYDGFEDDLKYALKQIEKATIDVTKLIRKNRIFLDRTQNICIVTKEQAISYGFTGPCLRASGVEYDIRKVHPYYYYDQFDFDIPVGEKGDVYDRIFVRFEEIYQSIKLIRQYMKNLPGGSINVDDKRVTLPDKSQTYNNIEGLINHFKLIFEGVKVDPGEIYDCTEAANGELGFFIVSDGSGYPYKVKVRPPCFYIFSSFADIIEEHMIADAIACLGSLNIIAGELDR
ncbi:MAG: NADH-quinone oxidoreductase subunit D [Candidatus Sericytochromatia bacterium]|nr:MAG: NADH-quinone oxidoreductase subunit D [Candidatus Sericytochromatia bacterium]